MDKKFERQDSAPPPITLTKRQKKLSQKVSSSALVVPRGLVIINARDWGGRNLNGHENFQADNVGS